MTQPSAPISAQSPDIPAIAPAVLHQAYADAVRCYPDEACGLLLGPRGTPDCDQAHRCENQQNRLHQRDPVGHPRDARTGYALGMRDLQLLDSSLASERPVKVIYHSHIEVGAYFSAEDERAATFDGELIYPVDYLVIDCAASGVRGAKLFRFVDRHFVAVADYLGSAAPSG
jgi:adenylyltransferase/sulfurtransferase